jgi:hypothetical protein
VTGWWVFPVSSTNKTDYHDITDIVGSGVKQHRPKKHTVKSGKGHVGNKGKKKYVYVIHSLIILVILSGTIMVDTDCQKHFTHLLSIFMTSLICDNVWSFYVESNMYNFRGRPFNLKGGGGYGFLF